MIYDAEKIMTNYVEAYTKLYNRYPSDLRAIDEDWVVVNGARMRIGELEYLTKQLQMEYGEVVNKRRSMVNRLIRWFKGD